MKHVFIHAFAAGNLGDDLMMRILCTRYPKTRFRLYADQSYKNSFCDIPNVKVYSPSDPWVIRLDRLLNKIKKTEMGFWKFLIKTSAATVHIGGSVFTQHNDDYSESLNLDAQLRRLSKKMYVVGANFGPYVNDNYYRDYQSLFKKYDDICFRDQYSYQLHKNLPNVRYAPDVVFNYKEFPVSHRQKQVLVSMINMESRGGKYSISQYTDVYENFIFQMAHQYIQLGYKVLFMSFCSFQEDEKAIERVRNRLTEEKRTATDLLCYSQNVKECMQAFSDSDIVIGTRFHSIILGWLCGKKVLPIVYDKKTLHTLKDNGIEAYLNLDSLNDITAEDISDYALQLADSEPFDAATLIKQSEKQFEGLDKILS